MGLTFLDFFAGIGGFRLGMQQAGHIPVGWVEWDKFARKSFEAIHNPEGEWTAHDIRSVDYRDMPRADVWTFGFPCQDINVAGNQKGFSGDRSSLFFSVTRLLRQTKEWDSERLPSYLFIENVKNFLSVNNGWDFLAAQIELDEIGYECEWDVLNSKDFGVPQNRERVFIIGHFRGRGTRKVFPLGRENSSSTEVVGRLEKKVLVRPVLTPDREEKRQNGRRFKEPGEPMFTLTAQDKHGVAIREIMEENIRDIVSKTRPNEEIGITFKGNGDIRPHRLDERKSGISELNVNHENNASFTVTASHAPKVYGQSTNYRIRKLTPRECFRLQGFPDWAFDSAAAVNSDSQLYKQAGNSVTANVIHAIASQLV